MPLFLSERAAVQRRKEWRAYGVEFVQVQDQLLPLLYRSFHLGDTGYERGLLPVAPLWVAQPEAKRTARIRVDAARVTVPRRSNEHETGPSQVAGIVRGNRAVRGRLYGFR